MTSRDGYSVGLTRGRLTRRVVDRPAGVWWLSPPGAVAFVVPVTLGLAAYYSPADFRTYFRTPKSLTSGTAALFAVGGFALTLGALVAQSGTRQPTRPGRWPWLEEPQLAVLRRSSTVLYRVTLIGYLSFVLAAARNGVRAADVVSAVLRQNVASGRLEAQIGTVPGITTLTQVGIAWAVVATLVAVHRPDRRDGARAVVLGVITLLRAYLLTERLAVIEVAVPIIVVVLLRASQSPSSLRRAMVRVAPVPLVALLLLGFAASEYSRSYQFYKTRTNDGLLVFSAKRLSGYYATAYNNGQLLLTHEHYVGRLPFDTVQALWTAPGISQLHTYDRLTGRDQGQDYNDILNTYGNPEFNNPGGLAAPFVDYGQYGGLLALFCAGLATGLGYRAFVNGRVLALLLYPLVVTGLFELPRFLYWTLGRTVPAVVALLLVDRAVTRSRRRLPALGA